MISPNRDCDCDLVSLLLGDGGLLRVWALDDWLLVWVIHDVGAANRKTMMMRLLSFSLSFFMGTVEEEQKGTRNSLEWIWYANPTASRLVFGKRGGFCFHKPKLWISDAPLWIRMRNPLAIKEWLFLCGCVVVVVCSCVLSRGLSQKKKNRCWSQ